MQSSDTKTARAAKTSSISSKYSLGYYLMLLITLVIFVVSFASNAYLTARYQDTMDDLLDLNVLFVDVEATNLSVFNCYLYLGNVSREDYLAASNITHAAVDQMLIHLDAEYSREVMDLCRTVQTYLEQTDLLMEQLDRYGTSGSIEINLLLEAAYADTQQTVTYINQSFREIYNVKLADAKEMQQYMQRVRLGMNTVQLAFLALAMVLSIAYYRQVVDGITRSVKQLITFATGVTSNLAGQEAVHIETNDEFSVLGDTFNTMLDTIKSQISQIKEDSRVKQQLQSAEVENLRISSALQSSQLRFLQSRINPHFLFNTLNMISQTAHLENAEKTAMLMEATAEFLRYNLGKTTKMVTLHDEVENTQNYVFIQQCRFGERIAFGFDIDADCEPQQIPCMILQPLVENSVVHGVESMVSGGRVMVRLFATSTHNCLEVEDNGVGIAPDTLAAQRKIISNEYDDGEHIGLQNVYRRISLFFDGEVDFIIESAPGRTLVHIGLPKPGTPFLGGGAGLSPNRNGISGEN